MKSKVQGRNYLIQNCDEAPAKWNKKKTDKILATAHKALQQFLKCLQEADNISDDLVFTLYGQLVTPHVYDIDYDGMVSRLSWAIEGIKDLQEQLAQDDELTPPVDHTTLDELGFRSFGGGFYKGTALFERTIEDTGEKEITEEIVFLEDGTIKHRQRTTIWKQVLHGRSSESIKYEPLRMTKKLKTAALNTLEQWRAHHC